MLRMMRRPTSTIFIVAALFLLSAWLPVAAPRAQAQLQNPAVPAADRGAQQAQPPQAATQAPLPGVRNFTSVDAHFACGGALSGGAIESLKQAGFKSIVNLRAADEPGADVEAQTRAAREAGLNYIWLPFVTASPDAGKVDDFLKAASDPANQPMLIHCTSGGRASMFWAIKRVIVDGWPVDKAMSELPDLSKNVSPALRTFALDYLKQHARTGDAR